MVTLCQKYDCHYLFRICADHTCQPWSSQGRLLPACRVSELVSEPGKRFYGYVRLWQENPIETNMSACWDKNGEKACPKHDGALPYYHLLSVSIKQIGYVESDTVAKPSLDQPDSSRLARGIQKRFRQRYRIEHEMSV
jgi:hypothetical protein